MRPYTSGVSLRTYRESAFSFLARSKSNENVPGDDTNPFRWCDISTTYNYPRYELPNIRYDGTFQ